MAQVMTVVASGDMENGWSVDVDDGMNKATWTPPARDAEHAITQAMQDHFAKFGHNVPVSGSSMSKEERAEMDKLTRQHEDDMSAMAEMKAEIAKLKAGPMPKAEPAMSIADMDAKAAKNAAPPPPPPPAPPIMPAPSTTPAP